METSEFEYYLKKGNIDQVKKGMKEFDYGYLGNEALTIVCENGHVEILKMFLEDNKIVQQNSGFVFMTAIRAVQIEIVRILLEDGTIDPSVGDSIALAVAVAVNQYEIVELLMNDSRIDPSDNNNTALEIAYDEDNKKIMELLYTDQRVIDKAIELNQIEWLSDEIKNVFFF